MSGHLAVEVTISEDQHVHIEYSENSKEYYDIAVSEDSILTMTGASDKDLSDYMGGKPSDDDTEDLHTDPRFHAGLTGHFHHQ